MLNFDFRFGQKVKEEEGEEDEEEVEEVEVVLLADVRTPNNYTKCKNNRRTQVHVYNAWLVDNEKMGLVENVQSALWLVENEKMGLVHNVQSDFRLVENQNNTCPLLDRQCMNKSKL